MIRSGETDTNVRTSMWSSITPDYFRTMQIPVLAGRSFDRNDNRSSTPVAVISQTLAERVFPRANALGQIVDAGFRKSPVTIVGVVGNVCTTSE